MDNKDVTPLLKIIIVGTFTTGLIFAGMGVWLVILGATGETNFSFFGQTMKSSSVGIAAISIGAITIVLLIKQVLRIIPLPKPEHPESLPNEWPATKTAETLRDKLLELSGTQRKIVKLISPTFGGAIGGWPQEEIATYLHFDTGEIHYRLRELELYQLVQTTNRTFGAVYKLPSEVESLIEKFDIIQRVLESADVIQEPLQTTTKESVVLG